MTLCEKWQREIDVLKKSPVNEAAPLTFENSQEVYEGFISATQKMVKGSFTATHAQTLLNKILEAGQQAPIAQTSIANFLSEWATSKAVSKAKGTALRYQHTVTTFLAQDTTSQHNLTDSQAFDAASPAVSLGQCTSYGHLSDQPPLKPNSPLDKTYLQAAGREVITASIGGLASCPRAIAHQAATFYISAEGHIATGLIDTDGPNSDSVTFGASDAEWTHSLKTVIIGGCSVLNIKDYRMAQMGWTDTRQYWELRAINAQTTPFSPGEAWEGTGPKYLLGYAFHAPRDDQGSAGIATTYETLVAGGMNPIAAWGKANNGTTGNNACAIDVSVSPHQYWYLKLDATSSTGLTWTSVTKTGAGWP